MWDSKVGRSSQDSPWKSFLVILVEHVWFDNTSLTRCLTQSRWRPTGPGKGCTQGKVYMPMWGHSSRSLKRTGQPQQEITGVVGDGDAGMRIPVSCSPGRLTPFCPVEISYPIPHKQVRHSLRSWKLMELCPTMRGEFSTEELAKCMPDGGSSADAFEVLLCAWSFPKIQKWIR